MRIVLSIYFADSSPGERKLFTDCEKPINDARGGKFFSQKYFSIFLNTKRL